MKVSQQDLIFLALFIILVYQPYPSPYGMGYLHGLYKILQRLKVKLNYSTTEMI